MFISSIKNLCVWHRPCSLEKKARDKYILTPTRKKEKCYEKVNGATLCN